MELWHQLSPKTTLPCWRMQRWETEIGKCRKLSSFDSSLNVLTAHVQQQIPPPDSIITIILEPWKYYHRMASLHNKTHIRGFTTASTVHDSEVQKQPRCDMTSHRALSVFKNRQNSRSLEERCVEKLLTSLHFSRINALVRSLAMDHSEVALSTHKKHDRVLSCR